MSNNLLVGPVEEMLFESNIKLRNQNEQLKTSLETLRVMLDGQKSPIAMALLAVINTALTS